MSLTVNKITAAACDKDGNPVDVPVQYLCPITQKVMLKPLMTRSGANFERNAILEWLQDHTTCPITRSPLRVSDLLPNRHLEAQIRSWRHLNRIAKPHVAKSTATQFIGIASFSPEQEVEVLRRACATPHMDGRHEGVLLSF